MSKIGVKQLKNLDMGMVTQMFKEFDKNFSTLATNQIYIQENQVEFEKYLKAILQNQEKIMSIINNGNTENIIKEIETTKDLPTGRMIE